MPSIAGYIVPVLLLILAIYGLNLVLNLVIYLHALGRVWSVLLLTTSFSASFTYGLIAYLFVFLDPVRAIPEPDAAFFSQSHEVGKDGEPPRKCFEGRCNGSWKPPRSRHCKYHQVCRAEFDHCCTWFNNDIYLHTLKPFLAFLFSVPCFTLPALYFLVPICWRDINLVTNTYWTSEALYIQFWRKKRSYTLGPVARYVIGLYYCFEAYPVDSSTLSFDRPSFSRLTICFFALFVTIVAVILISISINQLCQGRSTVEIERTRKWNSYLSKRRRKNVQTELEWDARRDILIKDSKSTHCDSIVTVGPDLPIYSAGSSFANCEAALGVFKDWLKFWKPGKRREYPRINDQLVAGYLASAKMQ